MTDNTVPSLGLITTDSSFLVAAVAVSSTHQEKESEVT